MHTHKLTGQNKQPQLSIPASASAAPQEVRLVPCLSQVDFTHSRAKQVTAEPKYIKRGTTTLAKSRAHDTHEPWEKYLGERVGKEGAEQIRS